MKRIGSAEGTAISDDATDKVIPQGSWSFDEQVTHVFDNMLERSIPQYHVMRRAVFDIGMNYIGPGSTIIDCGASRGDAIAPFVKELTPDGHFVCIETSEPMVESLRARFAEESVNGRVTIHHENLKSFYPDVKADLTLAILTLQFIPIEYRQAVVHRIFRQTKPGGVLILVEKILGADHDFNDLMVRLYHQHKLQHGYTREDIDRKALSLEGVLVPVTAQWNMEFLSQAGFQQVDYFWRWMNFAGWLAVKPG